MSKDRKFKFAKLRLVHQARLYWDNIERMSRQRGDMPIATWRAMKVKLREKYLPMSYEQRLLDQWQRLTQGNKIVSEYISKFDEFVMRCNVVESEAATLSRFRAGLYEEIQRELFLREVHDLYQAYQVARDCERFQRRPLCRQPENPRNNFPRNRSSQNPSAINRLSPANLIARREDKGKSPEVRREGNVHCFRCHKIGYYASQSPTKALHIGEIEEEVIEPIENIEEEEVYEAGVSLADDYEGDEEDHGRHIL